MSNKSKVKHLYKQANFPVFQNKTYGTAAEAMDCVCGDIDLVEDLETGLVHNSLFRDELLQYDQQYQNEQSNSPFFRQHLGVVAEIIRKNIGTKNLVEVGCGKGAFLEILSSLGFEITGFDPAYEGDNPTIEKAYFNPETGIHAKGLILRHVLEHIKDPVNFLCQLKKANGGGGLIYIEVPCFDWICKHRTWFDIYYEHVNYFRLSDFDRMFDKVVKSGRVFEEQYLYVVADLETIKTPKINQQDRVKFPGNFINSISDFATEKSTDCVIWGGASKGTIFALLIERAGHRTKLVIDINTSKQGRYLPATGLLVHSPESALKLLKEGSDIYIMNSNYTAEIKQITDNAYVYIEVANE
jgi:hypothetical protein